MTDLVTRLSEDLHPVSISARPDRTLKRFEEQIARGYVLVRFTDTHGGTELCVPLDRALSDFSVANFETATGRLRVCGRLTLDDVPVQVTAEIELPSMCGRGNLKVVANQKAG